MGLNPFEGFPHHSKTSRRDGPFWTLETRKKARNSGLFSYLHHFWQVNLAGAEGLSLACRLGCCSPVGERPAPTEAGAETGAAERHWRSLTPRHAVWSGCGRKHQGAGEGRCWTVPAASHKTGGARLVLRGNFGPKREGKPRKSRKYVDENRQRPYNKKCRKLPAGVCCRQAVSHSLYSTST